ncbi:MAG: tetratricopeptide repeat protein [Candidatus Omnitrophica bacterium]|nr:tetratricopeptide repeat protein [Candidatus Omnitrophota bacterium]
MNSVPGISCPPNSPQVDLVDDHDEVYQLWKARGVYQAILVHFDQHPDFQWISDKQPLSCLDASTLQEVGQKLISPQGWTVTPRLHHRIHIGNYLSRVFQEKMVRKWYWVVPDPQWKSPHLKFEIWQNLLDLYKIKMGPMDYPRVEGGVFRTSFWGVETIVASLEEMPVIEEPVLLNIDVDYFAARSISKLPKPSLMLRSLPWIWPEEFYRKLQEKGIRASLTAVSHSVRGGFTPILMKFFGVTLCELSQGRPLPEAYHHLKQIWLQLSQGQSGQTQKALEHFHSEGIFEATRLFLKANLLWEEKRLDEARLVYEQAALIDPEFRTSDSCFALHYEEAGRYTEAYQEYSRMGQLLQHEAWPKMGEALYLSRRKEWRKAAAKYLEVIAQYPDHASAHRHLGEIHLGCSHHRKALEHLLKAMRSDSTDPQTHLGIAECQLHEGNYEEARKELREALRMGWHKPRTYALLAAVYLRQGNISKALECFAEEIRIHWLIFTRQCKQTLGHFFSI